MTVESDLFDRLKTLVTNRVYPLAAPPGVVTPYIVYQKVGGLPVTFVESAMPSKANARFQITAWATTCLAASALIRAVDASLRTSAVLRAEPLGGVVDTFEPDTQLYGARQFFSIWFDT
jgi:hypothetical protein